MRARTLPLYFAAVAFATSVPCLAANPSQGSNTSGRESSPTHVLGFAAGEHFDQAETLTRAIKKAIENSTNQKLGSGEFSLEVLTAALGCPEKPDQTCLKKIATKISSQRFLWGTIDTSGQRVDAELHLHADDDSDKKVKFSYRANQTDSTDGELLGIASNAAAQLLGPLRYRVVVQSSLATGVVWVDGKEAGTLVDGEASIEVSGGDHLFRLRSSGSKTGSDGVLAEQQAKVQVTDQTRVRLDPAENSQPLATLKPTAGASKRELFASDQARPRATFEPVTEASNPGSAQRTWGYVMLATGGVLLAGGAVAAVDLYVLNHKDNFERYRNGLAPTQDACTEANNGTVVPSAMTPQGVKSLCRNASILEIGQVVLLATGVLATGTGLTLLLTSQSAPKKAATAIEPRLVVGRNRADFGVSLRF